MSNFRTNRCLPNRNLLVQNAHGLRTASNDHKNIAFQMASMDVGNSHTNKNVDGFGGVPFYSHMGSKCHRGADPFKKFHASETAKRVLYNADGTGRDGYITKNSGGLTVSNNYSVMGSDNQYHYQSALRGYGKDTVSPYASNAPMSLQVVDKYLHQKLSNEDPEHTAKYARHINRILEKQQVEAVIEKTSRSPRRNVLSESLDVSKFNQRKSSKLNPSSMTDRAGGTQQIQRKEIPSAKKQFLDPKGAELVKHKTMTNEDYTASHTTNAYDVCNMLRSMGDRVTKQDLFFRKQDKLMRNGVIPSQERIRLNQKMKFQHFHSNGLSQPKQIRDKWETGLEEQQQNGWAYSQTKKDTTLSKMTVSNQNTATNAARPPLGRAVQSPGSQMELNYGAKNGRNNAKHFLFNSQEPTSNRRQTERQAIIPAFNRDPSPRATNTLAGGLLLGQGTSLNTCGGDLQVGISKNAHSTINKTIIERAQQIERQRLGEVGHLQLKKEFKYKPEEETPSRFGRANGVQMKQKKMSLSKHDKLGTNNSSLTNQMQNLRGLL